MDLKQQIRLLAERSRDAARALAKLNAPAKDALLHVMAAGIEKSAGRIKVANAKDLESGKKAELSPAMLDRLTLTDKRIAEQRLGEIVRELEAEAAGIIAPKPLRVAAQRSMTEHLAEFIADLKA